MRLVVRYVLVAMTKYSTKSASEFSTIPLTQWELLKGDISQMI